jgi:Ca-activated chloride channel family protein
VAAPADGPTPRRFRGQPLRGCRHALACLGLLAISAPAATRDAESYFHQGARHYLATNEFALAKTTVSNGLALYPDNPKLKRLWDLLNQQQQQQQQQQDKNDQQDQKDQSKQDQQQQKDQQSKEQQQKSEQQKKEEQAKQEQQKREEQQKQEQASKQEKQDGEDKKEQQAASNPDKGDPQDQAEARPQGAKALRMTPQQAVQLLESLKGEEKAMLFRPVLKTNRQDRLLKDW